MSKQPSQKKPCFLVLACLSKGIIASFTFFAFFNYYLKIFSGTTRLSKTSVLSDGGAPGESVPFLHLMSTIQ
jgi:hypothetical protein